MVARITCTLLNDSNLTQDHALSGKSIDTNLILPKSKMPMMTRIRFKLYFVEGRDNVMERIDPRYAYQQWISCIWRKRAESIRRRWVSVLVRTIGVRSYRTVLTSLVFLCLQNIFFLLHIQISNLKRMFTYRWEWWKSKWKRQAEKKITGDNHTCSEVGRWLCIVSWESHQVNYSKDNATLKANSIISQ